LSATSSINPVTPHSTGNAELLFGGDNLGVTSDKWISAPRTMHLVNHDGFLVNARVLASGAQRYTSDLKIVESRTVTRDLNTNVVTSDETPARPRSCSSSTLFTT
jgi:hypothetical protein